MKKTKLYIIIIALIVAILSCESDTSTTSDPITSNTTTESSTSHDQTGDDSPAVAPSSSPTITDYTIIDHNNTDLSRIPSEWINHIKTNNIILHYAHRSHGSQLLVGAEDLANSYSLYAYDSGWAEMPNATSVLGVWDGQVNDDYIEPGEYWQGASALSVTRSILITNPSIKYSMWSWCGELATWSASEVQSYLDAINQLQQEFPSVTFIYMTSHAQATGAEGWNRHQRNEQIRAWVKNFPEKNRVLYDFADIESWYNGEKATTSYDVNTYPYQHPHYYAADGSPQEYEWTHSTQENSLNKGKALWWMIARLEGWDGNK